MPGVTARTPQSRLRIFDEAHPDQPLLETQDLAAMARELARIGVRFEPWQASKTVAPGASPEAVMEAYRPDQPGRASCRARVCKDGLLSVVALALNNKCNSCDTQAHTQTPH